MGTDLDPEAELYPAVLKLADRPCLVAGGGAVALRKAGDLLRCRARVHAVAPAWCEGWGALEGGTTWLARSTRPFDPADLEGVTLVVAATDDRRVQEEVARHAGARGVPVNVVDVPELCSYYVPATLRRGSLVVSVSTEGRCPALAVAVRDRLARLLPEEIASGVERLVEARLRLRARSLDGPAARAGALRRLLEPRAVDDLLEGRLEAFRARVDSWIAAL